MDSFRVVSYNSLVCDLASYLDFQTVDAFGGLIFRLGEPRMSEHGNLA